MPSDAILRRALGGALGPVGRLERRPHPYATSHSLEHLRVHSAAGVVDLLLKDLAADARPAGARRAKPAFLDDPRREAATYRRVLAPARLGTPRLYAADGTWLVLERVPGVELWQVGELDAWCGVARCLARLHRALAGAADAPHLIAYDRGWYRLWFERARTAARAVSALEHAHDRAVHLLLAEPTTVIHGELYASNVLVAGSRVCIVDWETAARAPGVLDLAALTSGWDDAAVAAMAEAYGKAPDETLAAARLHLALRWLGWAPDWQPPAAHRRDWLADAVDAAEKLGAR